MCKFIFVCYTTNLTRSPCSPADSETHFKVVVVSGQFESLRPLQRHRMVNTILASELQNSVHALSIVAMAPQQWDEKAAIPPSPPCLGGDGSLPSKKSSKESS